MERKRHKNNGHYIPSVDPGQNRGSDRFSVDQSMDFADFLAVLNRHRFLIFFLVILSLGVTFYLYFNTQKFYQANTTLFINIRNSGALISGGQTFTENVDTDFTNTLVALIRSDEVATSVRDVIMTDPVRKNKVHDIQFSDDPALSSKLITSNIRLRVGGEGDIKKANIIQVSYQATTPIEALIVLEEIVKQFNIYFEQEYSQSGEIIAESIRKNRLEIQNEITKVNNELKNFIRTSKDISMGDSTNNPLLERLKDLETKLVEIDFQKLKYQKRLSDVIETIGNRKITDIPDKEIITILSSADDDEAYIDRIITLGRGGKEEEQKTSLIISKKLSMEIDQRNAIENKITEMKIQGMADDNPNIVNLREQLRKINEITGTNSQNGSDIETMGRMGIFTYSELLETYLEVLQNRIDGLSEQQTQMNSYIASQDTKVRDIIEYCQTIDAMKYNLSTQKEMFYQLGRKLDEVALTKSYGGYQVKTIDPPILPKYPVSPNLKKYTLIGLTLGLLLGVGLAFLLDMTDTTFRTPEEVENSCQIPLLAQIPSFAGMAVNRNSKKNALKAGAGVPSPKLFTYHFPNAPQCEIFGVLLAKIFTNPDKKSPRTLLISSAQPEEGKSMFSCNLAIKMAEMGKKVLLIDGDLRKPDLHKWFTLKNIIGISEVLLGENSIEEAVQPTTVENLSFLSVGTHRKNPSNLYSSENFDTLLATLKTQYDVVIIDSSPVLEVADAGIVAPKVDGVVFCLRIRKWARPISIQGVQLLSEVGANLLGCVVNCYRKHRFYNEFALVKNRYSYGYGQGYGNYGYGYGNYGYGYGYGYGKKYGYGYGKHYGYGYGKNGYGRPYGKPYGNLDENDSANQEERMTSESATFFPNLSTVKPDEKQSV